jgi:DinB family
MARLFCCARLLNGHSIFQRVTHSLSVTRSASRGCLPTAGRLQHMIWHEGYHHGQIKLALKLAGRPISRTVVTYSAAVIYFSD